MSIQISVFTQWWHRLTSGKKMQRNRGSKNKLALAFAIGHRNRIFIWNIFVRWTYRRRKKRRTGYICIQNIVEINQNDIIWSISSVLSSTSSKPILFFAVAAQLWLLLLTLSLSLCNNNLSLISHAWASYKSILVQIYSCAFIYSLVDLDTHTRTLSWKKRNYSNFTLNEWNSSKFSFIKSSISFCINP